MFNNKNNFLEILCSTIYGQGDIYKSSQCKNKYKTIHCHPEDVFKKIFLLEVLSINLFLTPFHGQKGNMVFPLIVKFISILAKDSPLCLSF